MKTAGFKKRMLDGDRLVGTFIKTASHDILEVLAISGLDFVCLDAEHSAFDRKSMDVCLALARALDLPTIVRVGSGSAENILQALDSGAVGVVVPHVTDAARAAEVAKAARFGLGGRGFAGATRWAGLGTKSMPEVLAQSAAETFVLAQIEEPEGVDAVAEIAATVGIDGLFIGPADLSISYGKTDTNSPELHAAYKAVGEAARAAGKAFVTWAPTVEKAAEWRSYGVNVFFIGSEHSWILQGARAVGSDIRDLD
ncbi:MAG: aldolase/citrate lyase family protein [Paracoccaceae bacterium]